MGVSFGVQYILKLIYIKEKKAFLSSDLQAFMETGVVGGVDFVDVVVSPIVLNAFGVGREVRKAVANVSDDVICNFCAHKKWCRSTHFRFSTSQFPTFGL